MYMCQYFPFLMFQINTWDFSINANVQFNNFAERFWFMPILCLKFSTCHGIKFYMLLNVLLSIHMQKGVEDRDGCQTNRRKTYVTSSHVGRVELLSCCLMHFQFRPLSVNLSYDKVAVYLLHDVSFDGKPQTTLMPASQLLLHTHATYLLIETEL